MKKVISSILIVLCLCFVSIASVVSNHTAEVAADYIKVKHPVLTAFANDTKSATLSLQLINAGQSPHKLVAVVSPFAQSTKLNIVAAEPKTTTLSDSATHSLTLKPQGKLHFAPQTDHIALINLAAPLTDGDHVPITLIFADGSHIKVRAVAVVTHRRV